MKILKECILVILTITFLTGCIPDPTPKEIDLEVPKKQMAKPKFIVSIKKGDTLKGVIKEMQNQNKEYIIVDKTEEDIVFDRDIENISTNELKKYLKVSLNKNINFRKYSDKIITIEERIIRDKKDYTVVGSYKIPDKEIHIDDKFTYEELFALLRDEKINIYTDIYKDSSGFSLNNQVPQFKGNFKEFLNFIATNEKLFVVIEDNGIKLKDVQTVTYNLKLPKVNLAPALSTDGSSAVISIESSLNGTINEGTKIGTIDPLKSLEEQIEAMIDKNKINYNINKTNGSLSVTGDFESMKIVDMIVEDFQSIYDTAIKIELHIYQVALNNENAFGIDYQFLKNSIVGEAVNIGSGLTSALSLTQDLGSNYEYSKRKGLILGIDGEPNTYEKTQGIIFKNLNKFGKTSVLTKPTLETINNLPVSLDMVDSMDYVAKIERGSSTSSTNSGLGTSSSSVDIDIETVTTGYSVVLHPKIDGEYIQIALKNITSTLNNLIPYTYKDGEDENVLYLKDVSAKQFSEIIKVKEGEIAIIGGYISNKDSSLKNGLPFTEEGDSTFDAITSAKEANKKQFEIVLTISASII